MYSILNVEEAKSYATEANAMKAVEKALGKPDEAKERDCNVLMVRNSKGRFVPVLINIRDGMSFSRCLATGFMCVN